MLKLWVDDVRKVPDDSWTLVRSVTTAIRILHTQHVSEVSLDHDNSHAADGKRNDDFNNTHVTCPETYQAVAYYIAAMPKERHPRVQVHSANPGGADKIRRILLDSGIVATMKAFPHPWGSYVGPDVGDGD